MFELASGWTFEAERGPDGLFVRLHPESLDCDASGLANEIWQLLQQHFGHRLVLELDDVTVLRSNIINELITLYKRIDEVGGLMRICGLTDVCQEVLQAAHLDTCLAQYRDREDAMMGGHPGHPK